MVLSSACLISGAAFSCLADGGAFTGVLSVTGVLACVVDLAFECAKLLLLTRSLLSRLDIDVVRGEIVFCSCSAEASDVDAWIRGSSGSGRFGETTGLDLDSAVALTGDVLSGVTGSSSGYLIFRDSLLRSCGGCDSSRTSLHCGFACCTGDI